MEHLDTYHKITEEPLTKDERKQLGKGLIFIPIFVIICVIIFKIILSNSPQGFFLYAVIGMACLFAVVIFFISRSLFLDLNGGVKNVLQGIITRKESHDTNANASSGAPDWSYILHFGSYSLNVNKEQYNDFLENDLVEIRSAVHSKTIFEHSVIKHDAIHGEILHEGQELSSKEEPTPKWMYVVIAFVMLAFCAGVFAMFYFG